MEWSSELEAAATTAAAMLLGGVIGLEREFKNRPAGFRTHMLVAGAAALLMGISQLALTDPPPHDPSIHIQTDPLRLVEAVINGVAFIGAGTIFARRRGAAVAGITTASSLLMVAVIGVMTGLRHFVLAVAATVLTLGVLTLLNYVERRTGMYGKQVGVGNNAPESRDD
ncbi:MAG: MgtC/SapB family protein [Lysobacter sp.]|nr:MAG: MgtC/SapB family protein [Lysobacter sp.]